MVAIVVHAPVAGSHISDSYAGSVTVSFGLSVPLLPPVTKTLPSASKVALWSLRPPVTIDPVYFQAGVELFRLMVSTVAVGSSVQVVELEYGAHELPPVSSTLPSSYITAELQLRVPKLLLATRFQVPVPDTLRYLVA